MLIVPAAAVAAGNVGITGSTGNTAKVTASGSLQVAEATPASFYVNPKAIHVNTPHAVIGKAIAQP